MSNQTSILPTFEINIGNLTVRVLKDSGCQINLISSDLLPYIPHQIVQSNLELNLQGIPGSMRFLSDLVQFSIKVGRSTYQLEAHSINNINFKLYNPYLFNVASQFKQRGYTLADTNLLKSPDKVKPVQIILGVKNSYVLPEREIVFGHEGNSVYSLTPVGVVLKGDVNLLIKNVSCLSQPDTEYCLFASSGEVLEEGGFFKPPVSTHNEILKHYNVNEFTVCDDEGQLVEREILRATESVLAQEYRIFNNESDTVVEQSRELNNKLVAYILNNTTRDNDGRLNMPLLWNPQVADKLSQNQHLAFSILQSLKNKNKNKPEYLKSIDETFKKQEQLGIIEKIENPVQYKKEHPNFSYLPYMAIIKPDRETTKCRVVFLSNLKEQVGSVVSHNQAMYAGPNLNHKLSIALLSLRFNKYLVCFDLSKAFNQINLYENDQSRLLFMWFNCIDNGDYSVNTYVNKRLPFGLRCSPAILMTALYKFLVLDQSGNPDQQELKKHLYSNSYMDNCAISGNDLAYMSWAILQLNAIFNPYGFLLQQFMTNCPSLYNKLPDQDTSKDENKLLGLKWNTKTDQIYTNPITLNSSANTKREILSSIAGQFDPFGYNTPILMRSRLFLHSLQSDVNIGWDQTLSSGTLREWRNISVQANKSPTISIPRFVGSKDDSYLLCGFSDSSADAYGCVFYLWNQSSNQISFLLSKYRMVNKTLKGKSIPSLELNAIELAVETAIDLRMELSGSLNLEPINLVDTILYSDSMVALQWLYNYNLKLDKMQNCSVFVINRLDKISKLTESNPIQFKHIGGNQNPADCLTKPYSYHLLSKTSYISGPTFLKSNNTLCSGGFFHFQIPSQGFTHTCQDTVEEVSPPAMVNTTVLGEVSCIPFEKYSKFSKLVNVTSYVFKYINILKTKIGKVSSPTTTDYRTEAFIYILSTVQRQEFPDLFEFFESQDGHNRPVKSVPKLISKLNLFLGKDGLLRIKGKNTKASKTLTYKHYSYPILLPRKCPLVRSIVWDTHCRLLHAGCYSTLKELRKVFWTSGFYSVVKNTIKNCVICTRRHGRTVKLNQNAYRELRLDPGPIPFNNIYLDFMGPFMVKDFYSKKNQKVWVLVVTCMWSRAVNLKLVHNLSTREFLRAFQLHIYDYGVPRTCISDLGSQLTAGANIIKAQFNDVQSQEYLQQYNIQRVDFHHYDKGNSSMGSLVERLIKITKDLLYSSMRSKILNLPDFESLLAQVKHLLNKRPVAFKDTVRVSPADEDVEPISPELLLFGRELPTLNLQFHHRDPDWQSPTPKDSEQINKQLKKYIETKNKLNQLYNEEFIQKLLDQSIDKRNRYSSTFHNSLNVGDIVLLKDEYVKANQYPMGRVIRTTCNDLDEVTGAEIKKGRTGEIVKRHITSVIPLLKFNTVPSTVSVPATLSNASDLPTNGQTTVVTQNSSPSGSKVSDSSSTQTGNPTGHNGTRPCRRAAAKANINIQKWIHS